MIIKKDAEELDKYFSAIIFENKIKIELIIKKTLNWNNSAVKK